MHPSGTCSAEPSSGGTMLRMLGPAQKREVKATQNLSIIVLFFIVCWIPLYTINCVQAFCQDCEIPLELTNFCIILSHANSAVNPLLYAYHLRDFRAALKSLLCCLFGSKEDNVGNYTQGKWFMLTFVLPRFVFEVGSLHVFAHIHFLTMLWELTLLLKCRVWCRPLGLLRICHILGTRYTPIVMSVVHWNGLWAKWLYKMSCLRYTKLWLFRRCLYSYMSIRYVFSMYDLL